jgi:hypothetical protein
MVSLKNGKFTRFPSIRGMEKGENLGNDHFFSFSSFFFLKKKDKKD